MPKPKRSNDKLEERNEEVKETLDTKSLTAKREELIKIVKDKLLTNEQLKRGGIGIRVRYEQEKGYIAVVDEINELGEELGFPKITLGMLRK